MWALSFSHKLLVRRHPLSTYGEKYPKMVCGCPYGRVINKKIKNSNTHNPLILWNAFVNGRLHTPADSQTVQLGKTTSTLTLVSSKTFSCVESSMNTWSYWKSLTPRCDITCTEYSSGDFTTEKLPWKSTKGRWGFQHLHVDLFNACMCTCVFVCVCVCVCVHMCVWVCECVCIFWIATLEPLSTLPVSFFFFSHIHFYCW